MKHSIKFGLMGGMILFCLSMCLTSCDPYLDDIFGEWSRPTPGGDGGSSATVTSLTLGKSLRFDKNDLTAQTLTATVTPSNATITWSSDKESVATVDATGKVTPVAPGKATITAKAGDKTATSTVYVYDKIFDISAGSPVLSANGIYLINGNATTAVGNPISIPDGVTVTLNNVNDNAAAPIVCNGDATIILADGSVNTLAALSSEAGIRAGGTGKTLTIDAETAGTGKLTATGGSSGGAGIGTRYAPSASCGTIIINGGTISATGGGQSAGIGTGEPADTQKCDAIEINGGTISATGGEKAAGIGTGFTRGYTQNCGTITIGAGVTSVTATKGTGNGGSPTDTPNSIGAGAVGTGTQTCGAITIADPSKVTEN